MDASLHAALRAATREAHEGLDALVGDAFADVDGYAAFLRAHLRAISTLAPRLAGERPLGGDDLEAHRELLARDLRALGASVDVEIAAEGPRSAAERVGIAYVIEGSTLGGMQITRLLRERLGISAENGGAFFHSFGAEAPRRWRAFCRILNDSPHPPGEVAPWASETFRYFENCLS